MPFFCCDCVACCVFGLAIFWSPFFGVLLPDRGVLLPDLGVLPLFGVLLCAFFAVFFAAVSFIAIVSFGFGVAIGGDERAAIHKAHRLGALLTTVTLLAVGIAALRAGSRFRVAATAIIALVVLEFAVGLAAIVTHLPILLAVAHNGLAALMLLCLIKLLMLDRRVAAT